MRDGIIRRSCPLCGGRLIVSSLQQSSKDFFIKKNGRISKKYTLSDSGPMEVEIAACESCEARWEADEFMLDSAGRFIDYKYERAGGANE